MRLIKILYLGNKLSRHGFTPTGVEYLGMLFEKGPFHVVYASEKLHPLVRLWDMVRAVIANRDAEVILIDTYSSKAFYYAWVCGTLASFLNVPFILVLRGGNLPSRISKSPTLSGRLFNKARAIVAVSKYLMNAFSEFKNVRYIPNTIDIRLYQFKNRQHIRPRLLWVRSFHKVYNPRLAIRVVSLLKTAYPEVMLTMVGPDKDGSKGDIERMINDYGLTDCIKLTGKLSKAEWISLSADYDIFINTTNFDNMPVSVTEAMALGLPVVSTDVGGVPYLVEHEVDGLLVGADDDRAFYMEISRLLEDHLFANVLAKNARRKVERFDNEIVLDEWKKLIHEIV